MNKKRILLISIIIVITVCVILCIRGIESKETREIKTIEKALGNCLPEYNIEKVEKAVIDGEEDDNFLNYIYYDVYLQTDKSIADCCYDLCDEEREIFQQLHEYDMDLMIEYFVINDEYHLQLISSNSGTQYVYDNDCQGNYRECKYTKGSQYGESYSSYDYFDTNGLVHMYGHKIYKLSNGKGELLTKSSNSKNSKNKQKEDKADNKKECLKKAQNELDSVGGHSQTSLRMALKYYGYTDNEIDYAIKNVSADWTKQAKQYCSDLCSMGYTYQEAYSELVAYGFTIGQAEAALNAYY